MDVQETGVDTLSQKMGSQDGVLAKDSGRPRKKLKWRWHWKKKENQPPQVAQFSHNPPGHTCGLPCCIQDNESQVSQPKAQRGCVPVPLLNQADLSDSNFVMKRKQALSRSERDVTRYRRSDGYDEKMVSDPDKGDNPKNATSRGVRLSKSCDVIASAVVGVGSNVSKLHTLSSTEQIRQRHITLPDCPQTQHTIMFLSHQPGETSDFYEIRTPLAHVTKTQKLTDALESFGSQFQITDSNSEQTSDLLALKGQPGTMSPDEGFDKEEDLNDTFQKRRLANSRLPDVPVKSSDSGLAFEQEFRQTSPAIDDQDDNTSLYVDHVYDVLTNVKESAFRLSQMSALSKPGSSPAALLPGSGLDFIQSSSDMLPRSASELSLSDMDSVTFPGSVADNESCIYNGSLLSYATNDTDVSLVYPSFLARNRYLMGQFDHAALRREYFGSKLDQLSMDSPEREDLTEAKFGPNNSSPESTTNASDAELPRHKTWDDLGLPKPSIRVDEYDMNDQFPLTSRWGLCTPVSGEFDLDNNTKLKLWDLRLSTANKEQNQYSTFPLRRFTSDDVSFGYIPTGQELSFSQVCNTNLHKMSSNFMPFSIIPHNSHTDPTLYLQNHTDTFGNHDPTDNKSGTALGEWRQLFDTNLDTTTCSEPRPFTPTSSLYQIPANWTPPWKEESEQEPIIFSGIYEMYKAKQAVDVTNDSMGEECSTYPDKVDGTEMLGKNKLPNPDITLDPDYSICGSYVGGVSSTSSFGSFTKRLPNFESVISGSGVNNKPAAQSSGSRDRSRESSSNLTATARTEQNQRHETVIMTRGKFVDWRRQAEFYKDNNFITLIL